MRRRGLQRVGRRCKRPKHSQLIAVRAARRSGPRGPTASGAYRTAVNRPGRLGRPVDTSSDRPLRSGSPALNGHRSSPKTATSAPSARIRRPTSKKGRLNFLSSRHDDRPTDPARTDLRDQFRHARGRRAQHGKIGNHGQVGGSREDCARRSRRRCRRASKRRTRQPTAAQAGIPDCGCSMRSVTQRSAPATPARRSGD